MQERIDQALAQTKSALIWAYQINPHSGAEKLTTAQILEAQPEAGFVWCHVQADAPDSAKQLADMGLPKEVVDALCTTETRPKAVIFGQGMLLYLRGINRNPEADPEDMVSLRLWVTADKIVSARRKNRKLLSVQDVREDIDAGYCPKSPLDLMLQMIARIADRISETVDILDEELTGFETLHISSKHDRLKLAKVRRKAAAIRRYLAPQRDALDAIYRFNKSLSQEQTFELRDQTDRMTRYVEDLDLAKERAMVLQDEIRNSISEQQGMRIYVLSLVTAIFLPLSFLTGVFGMNIAGLPGTQDPNAFLYLMVFMGCMAIAGLVGMALKRWF